MITQSRQDAKEAGIGTTLDRGGRQHNQASSDAPHFRAKGSLPCGSL